MKLRKKGIILFTLLYFLTVPVSAYAIPASAASTSSSDAGPVAPPAAVYLMLDSQNCYEGMEKPYAEGYIPKAENGYVTLVLPILATGSLRNDCLQVSLDLGDSRTAPFVMKNYNKNIFLQSHSVNGGGKTTESYVADFRLELKESRSNGSYPIVAEVKGITQEGSLVSKEIRVYVTITDGKNQGNGTGDGTPDAPQNPSGDSGNGQEFDSSNDSGGDGASGGDGTTGGDGASGGDGAAGGDGTSGGDGAAGGDGVFGGDGATSGDDAAGPDGSNGQNGPDGSSAGAGSTVSEQPTYAPKILVQSCQLSSEQPMAGEEVTADIVLVNTSEKETVKNLTIKISASSEELTLLDACDTIYVEKLSPRKTYALSCRYQINGAAPQGLYELELSMDYADSKGNSHAAAQKVRLSSFQSVKMQFDPVVLPQQLAVTDVIEVSAQAMNLGKSKVYNVRAVLKADGLTPEGTIFIGDMDPGTKALGSTQVTVSSLSEGDRLYGKTEGSVTFYYEDEAGQEQTECIPFQTTIQSPFSQKSSEPEDEPGQWWILMAVLGGILFLFALLMAVRRVKRYELVEKDLDSSKTK